MRLAAWFKESGKTQEWLAGKTGCTQGRIAQIARGENPSLRLAAKIEHATGGAVTMRDLVVAEESAA
jgi:transcriptional regulator with XRE-family HTH domain